MAAQSRHANNLLMVLWSPPSANCSAIFLMSLGEPEKIPFTGSVKGAQVLDIDGDGRDDLLLVNAEDKNPFRFRLQNAAGQLGPEIHFPFPQIRSFWAEDLDGDHKMEMVTIAMQSGRAQVSNFIQRPAEPFVDSDDQRGREQGSGEDGGWLWPSMEATSHVAASLTYPDRKSVV